jgi:hypothetical protein
VTVAETINFLDLHTRICSREKFIKCGSRPQGSVWWAMAHNWVCLSLFHTLRYNADTSHIGVVAGSKSG